MVIRIELDNVRKYRNASEYHEVPRARCEGIEKTGQGRLIKAICNELAAQNRDINEVVEVWRGDTLCFNRAPLKLWIFKGERIAVKKDGNPQGK